MEKKSPKIGLYICDPGGTISGSIDLQAVIEKCGKIRQVEICEQLTDQVGGDFLAALKTVISEGKVDRLIWIGRFTTQQRRSIQDSLNDAGLNPNLNEWCDLELQGIGLAAGSAKDRAQKAVALIKMAVARVKLLQPLAPLEIPSSETAVVIGAGISGLHVAASFLERGKSVHLVEQQSGVGGKVALLSRFYPLQCDPHCGLEYVLKITARFKKANDPYAVKTLGLEGNAGNFSVTIKSEPRYVDRMRCNGCAALRCCLPGRVAGFHRRHSGRAAVSAGKGYWLVEQRKPEKPFIRLLLLLFPKPMWWIVRRVLPGAANARQRVRPERLIWIRPQLNTSWTAGAVVVTTGWDPYPLSKLSTYFGYGKFANVIGNLEMEQLLSSMSKGIQNLSAPPVTALNTVGFVQCVGSRNKLHLSYCSSVCCSVTLKQILQLQTVQPDVRCIVYYQDMRCNGFEEECIPARQEQLQMSYLCRISESLGFGVRWHQTHRRCRRHFLRTPDSN